MVMRLSERYVWALNLILVALLAYFLARSVNDILTRRMAGETGLGIPRVSGPATYRGSQPRFAYDPIIQRDIFNFIPQAAPVQVAAPAAANLHIHLIGTSQVLGLKPYIIVEDNSTQEQTLYQLGDQIPDAGQLVEVDRNRAVLESGGQRLVMDMPQDPNAPADTDDSDNANPPFVPGFRRFGPVAAAGRPGGAPGVQQVSPTSWDLNRSTVNSNLANMAQLFTQIRAIPNLGPNGQSNGFRLSEVQPGSIFQQIGLQNGDVLTTIEGQTIGDPAQAMQLLASLRNQNSIDVAVMRNGQMQQLHYSIH